MEIETPPQVELTAEEKIQWFRLGRCDLRPYALNTSFMHFSLPELDEGCDEIRFEWQPSSKCTEYLRNWIRERKLTTRVEDLQPSDWFMTKWKEWQKTLQSWHAQQSEHRDMLKKRATERAAKEAVRAARKVVNDRDVVSRKKRRVQMESQEGTAQGDEVAEMEAEDEDEDEAEQSDNIKKEDSDDEMIEEKEHFDINKIDVFGVDDVRDVGVGVPLFVNFAFEDWTMMCLRFELNLLGQAFRHDVNDPDRIGIHIDHLTFYYNKYFKKPLNAKLYGVDTVAQLLDLVRDTVVVSKKSHVLELQLSDKIESLGIFVMLTEECRRDRQRRVDLGEVVARLRVSQPQTIPGAGIGRGMANAVVPARPGVIAPQAPQVRLAQPPWYGAGVRPGLSGFNAAGCRPPGMYGGTRGFQPAWRACGR